VAFDSAALQRVAESVGDGAPIEWDAIEAEASDEQRPIIRQLRVLESLAHLHRTLPAERADQPSARAIDRSVDAPAIGNWGHLELVERLGGGTFGEVYRAWDRQLERDVALKVLRGDAPDPQRLIAEARLLARVRHQHVVTVYGVDTHDQRVGLWMELVRGNTLEQLISTRGPLSAREAALVGIDLCRALAAIHSAGLVHRDVKAQNVMREDRGRIVLMDLGTGRDVARGQSAAGLAGTPLYLAPEVFDGAPAGVRTDIYSLGVLLYHLVTGSYPVPATTFDELQRAHAKDRAVRLRDARPDLPTAFVTAVDRAMAHDPLRRYESVGAFEADLVRGLDESPAVLPRPAQTPKWRTQALAAGVLIAVAVGAYSWQPWRAAAPASVEALQSIAVLPLRNDSGDPAQEYFADGMTDEIISTLGRLNGLTVTSRTSSMQFKGMQFNGQNRSLPEIAKVLKVNAIVEGSVMLLPASAGGDGRKVRINARLIAAGTDTQIWNQTFEAIADDVVALERQVATAIATGIHYHLSEQQESALSGSRQPGQPQDFEAFNLYLRGRYSWNLRTREELNRSLEFFQQAIQRDSRYAAAHAGVADAYMLLGTYGMMPLAESSARALASASRAVELDDMLGEAHASLGQVHDNRLEWEAAEASYQRALTLQPGYARAHHWYASHLMRRGRFDEATKSIQQAMALDPLSPAVQGQLGAILFLSRRYDEAIVHLQRMVAASDTFPRAHRFLGEAHGQKRDFDRALVEIRLAESKGDTSADRLAYEASILALAGRRAEATRILQELIARYNSRQDGGPVAIAVVYAGLNDRDRAFEWLDRGVQLRDPWIGFLGVDPWFDNLRSDRRFATLLARTGLTR
jgi:serine/threonine protein kinase/tetratricopeptide (TPR) repeat protein